MRVHRTSSSMGRVYACMRVCVYACHIVCVYACMRVFVHAFMCVYLCLNGIFHGPELRS